MGKQQFGWLYQPLNRGQGVFAKPYQSFDLKRLEKSLWITEGLFLEHWEASFESILIDSLLPKLVVCDIYLLHLTFQNISFEQFQILTAAGNVTKLNLRNSLIKDKNGDNVPLEDILETIPKIENLTLDGYTNSFVCHQNAAKKVPLSLQLLTVQQSDENFNFEGCFKFIQVSPLFDILHTLPKK
uniref:Leucine-rich repeat domain-containing protein n=1 Tax=Panagrolaimus superbus TaxID=310955 RepID=A0A914Y9J6_9BILA